MWGRQYELLMLYLEEPFFGDFFQCTDGLGRAQKPWKSILLVLEHFTTTCLP